MHIRETRQLVATRSGLIHRPAARDGADVAFRARARQDYTQVGNHTTSYGLAVLPARAWWRVNEFGWGAFVLTTNEIR